MMKVEIKGNYYVVEWKHEEWITSRVVLHDMITTCIVSKIQNIEDNTPMPKNIISRADSYCSKKDQFCKNIGRKISMGRALMIFPKEVRKVFWETYGKEIGFK